ncbi:hypothetical protein [Sphaerisporangium perillae]|nr:hypothetical protein [Sphaerisporangium perillae]
MRSVSHSRRAIPTLAVGSVAGVDFGTVAALCRADPSLRAGF